MAIENCQLVNKNSAQHKTASCHQALCWNRAMHIKDRFEMLVEIFNGDGTSLVEHLAYPYSIIVMGIRIVLAGMRGNQDTVQSATQAKKGFIIIMLVPQQEVSTRRQVFNQGWSLLVVSHIGGSDLGGKWKPDLAGSADDDVQFPAVYPAVPA